MKFLASLLLSILLLCVSGGCGGENSESEDTSNSSNSTENSNTSNTSNTANASNQQESVTCQEFCAALVSVCDDIDEVNCPTTCETGTNDAQRMCATRSTCEEFSNCLDEMAQQPDPPENNSSSSSTCDNGFAPGFGFCDPTQNNRLIACEGSGAVLREISQECAGRCVVNTTGSSDSSMESIASCCPSDASNELGPNGECQ